MSPGPAPAGHFLASEVSGMSIVRVLCTYECDRCARQQTINPDENHDGFDWVVYRNEGTNGTITLCPTCMSFFYDFMQGKGVKPL